MNAVPVRPPRGAEFDWGPPVKLFPIAGYFRSTNRGYDVAPDGRFVAVASATTLTPVERSTSHFVTNWFEELRARSK
jgi:hypothetical protein